MDKRSLCSTWCTVALMATLLMCHLREGNTPDWALDLWHPWEKVTCVSLGFNIFTFLDAGSADGLLWQQREAEGWIWGVLRAVLEEEMGPWNARDHHKYHLPVVPDFWPMLSIIQSLNGPFCCGDSLKLEVNRCIPELTGFSVSCVWLSFWWCGRRKDPMATYG